ncbi:MAG TPA: hypothetical protein VI384_01200 [Candidatus Dormibacteraeota bacterium]
MALAVQFGLYATLLRPALLSEDIERGRPAVIRWLKTTIVFQAAVLAAAGVYVAVIASGHRQSGVAWVAPALGAVVGTALPLQVAVISIMRAGRRL